MKVYLAIKEYSDYDAHSFEIMKAFYDEEKAMAFAEKYEKELTFEERVEKACSEYRVSEEMTSVYQNSPRFELERPRIDQKRKHDREYVKEHEKACRKWNAERDKWYREVGNPYQKEFSKNYIILMDNFRKLQEIVQKDTFEKRPSDDNWSFSVQAIEVED